MAWVHILRGGSGHYYFGSTDDLERRIAEHQRGDNHTTRRFGGTIELVACRELPSIAEARKLEIAPETQKESEARCVHVAVSRPPPPWVGDLQGAVLRIIEIGLFVMLPGITR